MWYLHVEAISFIFYRIRVSQPVANSRESQPPAPPAQLCCTHSSELLPCLLVSRLRALGLLAAALDEGTAPPGA